MTRKGRRLSLILVCGSIFSLALLLVLNALEDNIVFFHTPTDIVERADLPLEKRFRIGGLVKQNSWKKKTGSEHTFFVTDISHEIQVIYKGLVPDLFREGQCVVVEGYLTPDGIFKADEVLAKHDENYMPEEVATALKKSGRWKGVKPQVTEK